MRDVFGEYRGWAFLPAPPACCVLILWADSIVSVRKSVGRVATLAVGLAATIPLASGCGGDSGGGSGGADNALEFSGRIDQVGPKFTGYGFVTRLDGVESTALTEAGGSEITEKDARVTFVFDADLKSRAIVGDSFSVDTEGTATFYLDDQPGASFDDSKSFAAGEKVATGKLRVTNVVTVYAPDSGIETASGSLELEDASSFSLGGKDVSIGEGGDEYRITLTGRGTRADALIPKSNFDFAGQAVFVDGG